MKLDLAPTEEEESAINLLLLYCDHMIRVTQLELKKRRFLENSDQFLQNASFAFIAKDLAVICKRQEDTINELRTKIERIETFLVIEE